MTRAVVHTGSTVNRGGRFLPRLSLALGGLCLGLFALLGGMPEMLVYDRLQIENGEFWRLLSGHLVHLDGRHLAINIAGLLFLGSGYQYLVQRETSDSDSNGRLALLMLASMLGISLSIYLLSPSTLAYCGISAVLNTLFAAVTIRAWRRTEDPLWLLLLAGALLKISWEWGFGSVLSADLTWPPHMLAHLSGLSIGMVEASLFAKRADSRPQQAATIAQSAQPVS